MSLSAESNGLRVAVLGLGQRGGVYARALSLGQVKGASLGAVCDLDTSLFRSYPGVPHFADAAELLRGGKAEALVIATSPAEHMPLTAAALAAGMHVFTEKPLATRVDHAERLVEQHRQLPLDTCVFATSLPLRADPRYLALRSLLRNGELGELSRVTWTVSDCFRSDAYYRKSSWRSEFHGSGGGGLLLNQCLHQLDLWQWLFGMPLRVHAFCDLGRFHDVEVEDRVTAHFEHGGGLNGVLLASTGESPGCNRLEVVGDLGAVVIDGEQFELARNSVPASVRLREGAERDGPPAVTRERRTIPPGGLAPAAQLANFVAAIRGESAPFAPAAEGVAAVELANALLCSGLERKTVELPLVPQLYETALRRRALRALPRVAP
jgi:predicted dehydrogenase